ncbi:MAG: ABC transporter permease [Bacteroidia bacterium]
MKISLIRALIVESISSALINFRSNILRTFLSLLGITIGVLCIIGILAMVDSLEKNVRSSISSLGDKVIYIQKIPWIMGNEFEWWKYNNRPPLTYRDMQLLQKRYPKAEAITYYRWLSDQTLKHGDHYAQNITIMAVTYDYNEVNEVKVASGRYFTEYEMNLGSPVIILGVEIANALFPQQDAIGRQLRMMGRKLTVIGILEQQGNNMFMGGNLDRQGIVPINFVRSFVPVGQGFMANYPIVVKGGADQDIDELKEEIRGNMRSIRKLSPRDEDNFALNEVTLISSAFDQIFGILTLVGWIIAGFSILVGGFGIANIMFVTVRERTSIIGIQKALGASKMFILLQFLGESVMLCILGGLAGIAVVYFGLLIVSATMDLTLQLSLENILIGVGLSSGIGIIAGLVPALQAARMDPIMAIRYKM